MRQRLLLTFLSLTAFVLMVLVIPLGIVHQQTERDNLTRRIERDAVATGAIAADVLREPSETSRSRLASFLATYTTRTGARVVILNRAGNSIIDTGSSRLSRSFASRPEFVRALDGRIASGERTSKSLGYRLMYVAVPVSSGGRIQGAVRISYPARELTERIRNYWLILGAASTAILLVVGVLGALVAASVTRPLRRLSEAATRVGEGDFNVRAAEDSGPDEVREVARRFNESVAALEALILEQRDFVADASHQLRTPLQALHLRLDNAQASIDHLPDTPDAAQANSDLAAAYRDVMRLSALVESLLVLERADRAEGGTLEILTLKDVIADRLESWQALAKHAGIRMQCTDLAPEITLRATRVNLEQVLDNLVDNAIAASPEGGTITIRSHFTAGSTTIEVIDEGPGMTNDEITHAFRRFHSTGGFGLGLPIVQRLVERDGGSIQLHRSSPCGLVARIEYPR